MKRIALALLLAAAPAAQCFQLERHPWSGWIFAAHSFSFRSAAYVDFVPYAGGIAAMVLFDYGSFGGYGADPYPLLQSPNAECDRLDLTIVGWWWRDYEGHALPGDSIWLSLQSDFRSRSTPVVDLYRTPSSFVVHPVGFPVRSGDAAGLYCDRPTPRYEPHHFPQLAAFLVAPQRGWW